MPMNLKVLDLSHHNPIASFKGMKQAGIVGIIHKASEGLAYADHTYAERRVLARMAGLLWGAYHFNSGDRIGDQVEHFLKSAAPDDHTLIALDWEPHKGHDIGWRAAEEFLILLGKKLGRKPVLYSGPTAKTQLERAPKDALAFFGLHKLWLAQYGAHPRWHPAWNHYWLWQYTDGTAPHPLPEPHKVAGVSGNLDCNHYAGSDEQLVAEWAA